MGIISLLFSILLMYVNKRDNMKLELTKTERFNYNKM